LQVEVEWTTRTVRWAVGGGPAVTLSMPAAWMSDDLKLKLAVNNKSECTATLLGSPPSSDTHRSGADGSQGRIAAAPASIGIPAASSRSHFTLHVSMLVDAWL